jgi:hypothetical protein
MASVNPDEAVVDWPRVLAFLPRLVDVRLQRRPWTLGGSDLVGYLFDDPLLDAFVEALYESGVVYPFDWAGWVTQLSFDAPLNPTTIERANLGDLRRLLTAHARQDRFSDGHLGEMIENGQIALILRRIAALVLDHPPDERCC